MLILASRSPRRQAILRDAGLAFAVRTPEVEEVRRPGEGALDYVGRLAREKARAVEAGESDIVLAADTVVVLEDEVLEKPVDAADAARMLRRLAGRTHQVFTGICLRQGSREVVDVAATRVEFAALSEGEIEEYVASGEPMDKAGAYGIQGLASKFIPRVEGCYFNVVGLPMAMVYGHLRALALTERETDS